MALRISIRPIVAKLSKGLTPGGTKLLQAELHRVREENRRELQRELQLYPPPAASSSYVRTGNLGRRWGVRTYESGGTLGITAENQAKYSTVVYGNSSGFGQRSNHASTGWRLFSDVMTERNNFWRNDINQLLKELE